MQRQSFTAILIGQGALFREGLARILSTAEFHIAASAPRLGDVALTSLPQDPAALLLIHEGEDSGAALEQIALFKNSCPTGRVAILANHYQPTNIISAFQAGAHAYFIEVTACDTFIKSLELIMLGEMIFPPAILSYILEIHNKAQFVLDSSQKTAFTDFPTRHGLKNQPGLEAVANEIGNNVEIFTPTSHIHTPHLSAREKCILHCITDGDSNKAIARKINIAEATVKVHVKAILRKVRVHNRTQAAIWAMSNGSLIGSVEPEEHISTNSAEELPLQPPIVLAQPLVR